MCGFVGMFNPRGLAPQLIDSLHGAGELLRHRGPDDEGDWVSPTRTCALGHRRLSIIDLSPAGHQPMVNEDGRIWIAYNGEVYNFQELRRSLEQRGHVFRSGTDTEVVLHGYEEWGSGVVDRLRGMFAFAICDTRNDTVFLARDRIGIKPLYYTWVGETFLFASETKALLHLPGVVRELDGDALREYLAFGKVYSPRAMFKNIFKFPAAHQATVSARAQFSLTEYWTPYTHRLSFPDRAKEEYYEERLRELLEESVRLRMISDVPVGVFLSGGVDSTANVAFMSGVSGSNVHTFTAGFEGQESYDERKWARKAAAYFGTKHDEIVIAPRDLIDELPRLSFYLDEPIADPTVIPLFFVSKLARAKGTIVVLNGDGGDELFCGYEKYLRYLRFFPYWRIYKSLPRGVRNGVTHAARGLDLSPAAIGVLERGSVGLEFYIGATGQLKRLSRSDSQFDSDGSPTLYDAVKGGMASFSRMRMSEDYAEWLSYWGVRSEVEHVFLHRADRMGMANSVEIRVPFLDHHLVEFAMQMPQALKHKNGIAKYILKKALKGIVPDEFLHRKKQGFCVPIREWAGDMMTEKILDVLPQIGNECGWISRDYGNNARRRPDGQGNFDSNGFLTWNLYSLATWYERWFG